MSPQDKRDIINACKQVERPFLYIMVFFTLLQSCDNGDKLSAMRKSIEQINTSVDQLKIDIKGLK